jgi:hypothetical protein
MLERGASEDEVCEAIRNGEYEPAKDERMLARMNFQFNDLWIDTIYPIKQVAPVFVEEETEIVVITVYTYYF